MATTRTVREVSSKARNATLKAIRANHPEVWGLLYTGWRQEYIDELGVDGASSMARTRTASDMQEIYNEEWKHLRSLALKELMEN